MSLLVVEDLTIALPPSGDRAHAVSGASFTVDPGEVLCIVGESGSGKSVSARAISGLLPATLQRERGKILFEGRDVLALSEPALRAMRGTRIGMIFQEPMTALNPLMRVGEQIAEVLTVHAVGGARDRVPELLAAVNLPDPVRLARSAFARPFAMAADGSAAAPRCVRSRTPISRCARARRWVGADHRLAGRDRLRHGKGAGRAGLRNHAERDFGDAALIDASQGELREFGVRTAHHGADLRDPAQIAELVQATIAAHGSLDILVNNAVVRYFGTVENFSPEHRNEALAVNLSAVFDTIRLALPGMRRAGWGRIVNMASVYGLFATGERVDYIPPRPR